MSLEVDELAKKINEALGATDKDGKKITVTDEMKTYARAVINTLKAGLVNNAPGTITGTGAPGGPLSGGAGSNGLITALVPTLWSGIMTAGNPTAVPAILDQEAALSTAYIMGAGKVSFAAGKITGSCTATPVAPGVLAAGAGSDGLIESLSGSAWSAALAAITQGGPLAKPVYNIIANYIMEKSVTAYATGTVNGAFAAGGGPLIAGVGLGGTIT